LVVANAMAMKVLILSSGDGGCSVM
jgi:hypothetical protein